MRCSQRKFLKRSIDRAKQQHRFTPRGVPPISADFIACSFAIDEFKHFQREAL